jgi:hypothetical protein
MNHANDAAAPVAAAAVAVDALPAPAPRRRGRPRRQPGPEGASATSVARLPRPPRPPLSARVVAARASDRARQVAAAVLEVLAGVRSPAAAAQALAVVPVRYYQLEARALAGLLRGCEPVGKGRPAAGSAAGPNGASADAALRSEHIRLLAEAQRLRAELARLQALLRTARSAFGLRWDPPPTGGGGGGGGKKEPGRKEAGAGGKAARTGRRRPRVRALRLAGLLRPAVLTTAGGSPTVPSSPAGG